MEKLPLEVAEKDVRKWLEYKRYNIAEDEDGDKSVRDLAKYFQNGTLVLNDDFTITHNLMTPITSGENPIEQIKYKPRVSTHELSVKTKGVKSDDMFGFIIAQISAIAGCNKSIIEKMDSLDFKASQAVSGFF